jgi:hypothetical protein
MRRHILILLFSVCLVACGDSGTGPASQSYNDISGSYSGTLAGLSQGIALNAIFSLTLAQNSPSLSGTYALTGTLNNGSGAAPVQGTGTLSGTIASGNNPSVNIAVRFAGCPNRSDQFSGAYDTANRRITITGPVNFFDTGCNVVLTYQTTIILNR